MYIDFNESRKGASIALFAAFLCHGKLHMKSQKLQMQECIRVRNATIRKAVQTEDRQATKSHRLVHPACGFFQGSSGVLPYYFYGKDTSSADMSGDKFFTFSDISFIEVVWDL